MANVFYISPIGKESPDLFQTFTPTLISEGHAVVDRVEDADIAFVDLFSNLGRADSSIMFRLMTQNVPLIFFDEVDFGGMSKEIWGRKTWDSLAESKKIVYFMRKMSKDIEYPKYVFPYEKTMMLDFPLTSPEDLNSRPYEIFFYGNTSPQRENVCRELSKHFKCDFNLGQPKIEHNEWLNRAMKSKLFLTADGGGFSDERAYQLITISPMLRQKNNHLQSHPFSDCINCLEVSEQPTQEEIEGIKAVLNDPEYLFEIYEEGINHMKEYYSEEARANYILSIIKENGIL